MAHFQGMCCGVHQTDISAVRWFKALPSRQFGPAYPPVWQQIARLQIIGALQLAREVIPQPELQPNVSQEIRRCLQYALLSRAAHKPFVLFNYQAHILYFNEVGIRVKPHSVLMSEIALLLVFE